MLDSSPTVLTRLFRTCRQMADMLKNDWQKKLHELP